MTQGDMRYGTANNSDNETTTLTANSTPPRTSVLQVQGRQIGVNAVTTNVDGVVNGTAVRGFGFVGVEGETSFVPGINIPGVGVSGKGPGTGVEGTSTNSVINAGVVGRSTANNGNGVIGEANVGSGAFGVWGKSTTGFAGVFSGNVTISGTLTKSGGGLLIDHVLDPANKYLTHSFVEAPEALNVYSGIVATDDDGQATVTLPDYFEALNRDFRYQLTVIGDFAQAVVAEEVRENKFQILTDHPGVRVSWQVTGVRNDPFAKIFSLPVESEKPVEERGSYLHPEVYGQPVTQNLNQVRGKEVAVEPSRPGRLV